MAVDTYTCLRVPFDLTTVRESSIVMRYIKVGIMLTVTMDSTQPTAGELYMLPSQLTFHHSSPLWFGFHPQE